MIHLPRTHKLGIHSLYARSLFTVSLQYRLPLHQRLCVLLRVMISLICFPTVDLLLLTWDREAEPEVKRADSESVTSVSFGELNRLPFPQRFAKLGRRKFYQICYAAK
ncbi:hypothetical protein K469DRAFT_721166 [Zopfia rhizophila CBS 207.26]|uniref:Uncharacterized protein n=1 Tax=Zopfia rhizophila CBS 207.26 TaxID=1314779 RepID=A0A6A6DCN9_9PEZI|nr:hypothetical protein K469DRAFT_721166 [Zopfia rhizophila CBS 207.26]